MKQQLLDALKAKFEGVSDKILDRIADKLAKTVTTTDDVQTAIDGVSFQQVLESYGDSRATEAQATAVKNYEAKHNLKDGKPIEQPKQQQTQTPKQAGGEDVPAWAKALQTELQALKTENAQMKAERTTASRKEQLAKITHKLPEPVQKAYSRISVNDMTDEDFNQLLADVNGEVEAIEGSLTSNRGANPNRPFVATANTGDKLTKAQEEAIAQREGQINNNGQPF